MKIVYNAMTMGISAVVAEACQLAASMDVDLHTLRSIVSMGSTNSGIFQKITEYLLEEDTTVLSISLENAAKDIRLAVDAAWPTKLCRTWRPTHRKRPDPNWDETTNSSDVMCR
ncbi:3-hydroxyisobutyrate dehydrogenase/ 6-phosphogluconate dehydrogenase [Mycobacteroides abscessus subsp. abscessus]|nr:3-hydroxyisobutyrate dehydrogenase/ 6-phosphogluconate dehydrogenase [Mycobacteroides abscessus subsp. abscessus]